MRRTKKKMVRGEQGTGGDFSAAAAAVASLTPENHERVTFDHIIKVETQLAFVQSWAGKSELVARYT